MYFSSFMQALPRSLQSSVYTKNEEWQPKIINKYRSWLEPTGKQGKWENVKIESKK